MSQETQKSHGVFWRNEGSRCGVGGLVAEAPVALVDRLVCSAILPPESI